MSNSIWTRTVAFYLMFNLSASGGKTGNILLLGIGIFVAYIYVMFIDPMFVYDQVDDSNTEDSDDE